MDLNKILNISEYKRLKKAYEENLLMQFVLEYSLTSQENLKPITAAKEIPEIHHYTLDEFDFILLKMAKFGFIEEDGFVKATSLGLQTLQTGQLKTEAAQLNIGIQNIRLQWVLITIAIIGISIQIIEILILPLIKYILK